MESRPQRLNLDELHQLRWLLGGLLMLLSVATVFYLDIGSELMASVVLLGILVALVAPALPARVPIWAHRLAFPAIVAFFAVDIRITGQLLPAIVRLDLLLLLYRGVCYRARRDDLQIVVLGLFLIVVAGVLTVSLLFAAQILVFTGCALSLLMLVTIAESNEGGQAPKLAVKGVVPPWASHVDWRKLFHRLWDISDWRLLASAAGLFVGVVVVSGLLFMAIPRFQLENSLFLERFITKRAMTGFNDSIKFGDITEITQDDSIAFDVDLSDPAQAPALPYWRMIVLDEYKNGGFKLSAALRSELGRERTTANILGIGPGAGRTPATWTFYLESGVSRYLPILGNFWALRFREAQNVRYSPDMAIVALRDEPAAMTAYRVEGMASDGIEIRDRAFAVRWRKRGLVGPPLQIGLDLSEGDKAAIARIDAAVGPPTSKGPQEFADRVMTYLRRTHPYSLSPQIPEGPGDPLVRWMASGEPGHCELFAGAFVLMARSAGIPAHVVTGFKGGTWNAYSGNYTIRNSDAHAWAEIWDGARETWLREDPLAVAAASDLSQQKGDAAIAGLMDRSWSARLNSLRVFWYRRIVNFDQQSQADTFKAVKEATGNSGKWLRTAVSEAAHRAKVWFKGPWNGPRIARVFLACAGALGALWLIATGRLRLSPVAVGRRTDPVRREAGRWLKRIDAPDGLVAELQRLRYGPVPTWPRPSDVFRRARRAASSSRRRRRASSRNTS
jgi:hypothetical protein